MNTSWVFSTKSQVTLRPPGFPFISTDGGSVLRLARWLDVGVGAT